MGQGGELGCWSGVPYLDDSHVEAGLLGQLLSDMASGFGGGSEGSFEGLQLLGFNCGAGPPPLGARVLFLVLVVGGLLVRGGRVVCLLGVVLHGVLEIRGQTPVCT